MASKKPSINATKNHKVHRDTTKHKKVKHDVSEDVVTKHDVAYYYDTAREVFRMCLVTSCVFTLHSQAYHELMEHNLANLDTQRMAQPMMTHPKDH